MQSLLTIYAFLGLMASMRKVNIFNPESIKVRNIQLAELL